MSPKENAVVSDTVAVAIAPPPVENPWMHGDKPVIYISPYYWDQMATQNQEIYINLFRVILTPAEPSSVPDTPETVTKH